MPQSSKIFIVTYPTIGSINVLLPLIHTLITNKGVQVVVYALDSFQKEIEKTGAVCRVYFGLTAKDMKPKVQLTENRLAPICNIFDNLNKLLEFDSIRLAKEIDADKPDLIFYDTMASYCKLVIDFINNNFQNANALRKSNSKQFIPTSYAPPCIVFTTSFGFKKVFYPYDADVCLTDNLNSLEIIRLYFKKMKSTRKTKQICKLLNLNYENIIINAFQTDPQIINLIFKLPELQPRHSQISFFHENIKFVGFSIDERMHLNGFTRKKNQEHVQACVNRYPVINPLENVESLDPNGPRLFYVSLGTALNENIALYLRIIKAFEAYSVELKKNKIVNNFEVIVSMGDRSRKGFEILKNSGELTISDNILITTSAPQIEILKRCSLFLTQCGMSSVGEG
jgi:UDP:flavonoid glycosyltransferase YjiC (YdhE family)